MINGLCHMCINSILNNYLNKIYYFMTVMIYCKKNKYGQISTIIDCIFTMFLYTFEKQKNMYSSI